MRMALFLKILRVPMRGFLINSFANRYVLGDFCVCREDWLIYSGETDNPCHGWSPRYNGGT